MTDIPRRTALLLGIPDAENLSKLAMVGNDIALMRAALSHSKYAIEVAGLSPETRLTRTSLLRKVSQFARSGREGDTLILYYTGHGLHYDGVDYLVPYDAAFDEPRMLPEFLVSVDFHGLFADCAADNILILIDACREGINLAMYPDAKVASLIPWSEGRISTSRRKSITHIFSCAAGEYSRYVDGPDGYSVFTSALATVLGPDHPACTLADIEGALQSQVDSVSRQHKKPKQTIRIRSERGSDFSAQSCTICEKTHASSFRGRESNWKSAATASPMWGLAQEGASDDVKRVLSDGVAAFATAAQRLSTQQMSELNQTEWRDSEFPLRCLSRAEFLCREASDTFKPTVAEVALIIGSIFCYDAIRSAALLSAYSALTSTSLDHQFATNTDLIVRGSLQTFLNKFSYVLSAPNQENNEHAQRRRHVTLWLTLKWICATPDFWHNGPGSFIRDEYWSQIFPDDRNSISSTIFDRTILLKLTRHLAVPPAPEYERSFSDLTAIRTHFASTPSEQSVREKLVLYLLSLSSLMAIDITSLSDVIAENILIDDPVLPSALVGTIASTAWHPVDRDRALQASCTHPAVDQALRQHVQAGDRVLQIVLQKALHGEDRLEDLNNLPMNFVPAGIVAAEELGPANYLLPHVQLRLSDRKVRDLLMGERLYGRKELAIRELYQNALDACRYRQARLEYLARVSGVQLSWRGRIVLRHGVTDAGRKFVECEDNGIGMGHSHLADCFACAGQRFAEMSEFLDEQAEWLKLDPPIRVVPNSQFGIGVFSYFMLGSELSIKTQRFEKSGALGIPLEANVSSGSGLFRVQNARAGTDGGTTVRIYLADASDARRVSCKSTLTDLLFVADFDTAVEEDGTVTDWPAGELKPKRQLNRRGWWSRSLTSRSLTIDPQPIEAEPIRSADGKLWWIEEKQGLLLADGIKTDQNCSYAFVNLKDLHKPLLSVNRLTIQRYDVEYVSDLLRRGLPALASAPWLSFRWLWGFGSTYPDLADQLVAMMSDEARTLPVKTAKAQLTGAGEMYYSVGAVGCVPDDAAVLDALEAGRSAGTTMPPLLVAHRCDVWRRAARFRLSTHNEVVVKAKPEIDAGDWLRFQKIALSSNLDGRYPWISGTVSITHIFKAAAKTSVSPVKVCDALHRFSAILEIEAPEIPTSLFVDSPLDKVSAKLISLPQHDLVRNVLRTAYEYQLPVSEVIARFNALLALGVFRPVKFALDTTSTTVVTGKDLVLVDLINAASQVDKKMWISATPLAALAAKTGNSVRSTSERLATLCGLFGLKLDVEIDERAAGLNPIENDDILLSRQLTGASPWISTTVSVGHILRAAVLTKKSIMITVNRFEELGNALGFVLPRIDWSSVPFDPLGDSDCRIVSLRLDGSAPWLSGSVPAAHVLAAAAVLGLKVSDVFSRLSALSGYLGFRLRGNPADAFVGDPTTDDVKFISVNIDGKHPWLQGRVSLCQILERSVHFGLTSAETVARLRYLAPALGLDIPQIEADELEKLKPSRADLSILAGTNKLVLRQILTTKHAVEGCLDSDIPLTELLPRIRHFQQCIPIEIDDHSLSLLPPEFPDDLDRFVLSRDFDSRKPFVWGVDEHRIFRAATAQRLAPRTILERMKLISASGIIRCPDLAPEDLPDRPFSNDELVVASAGGDGSSPWIRGSVPAAHLVATSYRTNWTIAKVVEFLHSIRKLLRLAFPSELVADRLQFIADEVDLILVSVDLDGRQPWIGRSVGARHSIAAVKLLGLAPAEMNQRLDRFMAAGIIDTHGTIERTRH